jgi:tetratricopeptide (TPR) repeat protein
VIDDSTRSVESPSTPTVDIEDEIALCTQQINESPSDHRWQMRLAKIYGKCVTSRAIEGWKELVNTWPDEWKLQTQLANALATSKRQSSLDDPIEREVKIWKELVTAHPTVWGLHVQLRKAFQKRKNLDEEIRVWAELVGKYPGDWKLQSELAEAYSKKENFNAVISEESLNVVDQQIIGWKKLLDKNPEAWELQIRLANAYRRREKLENVVAVLRTLSPKTNPAEKIASRLARKAKAAAEVVCWEQLVSKHPNSRGIQMQLDMVYSRRGDNDRAIKGWKDLVSTHPGRQELEIHLKRAYQLDQSKEGHPDQDELNHYIEKEIDGWKELVKRHPKASTLQTHLAEAYSRLNDLDGQIHGWIELVNTFPQESELRDRLVHALLQCESEEEAFSSLESLDWDEPKNQEMWEIVQDMFKELK